MSQKITGNRKYYFNNEYFDRIDTEEKAYWLGFLYADGYISSNNNGFGCSLKKVYETSFKSPPNKVTTSIILSKNSLRLAFPFLIS